jgi:hypothetical protein
METKKHIWQFSRIGGVNRVNIESGNDLLHLEQLDQKLWTALSCPVKGLEIDSQTLALIDTDNDGKIRVPEILSAVKWITSVVKDANCLVKRSHVMPLSEINTNTDLGKVLYASSKQVLKNIGKPDADSLTVEEASDTVAIFAGTQFNGDGIITEASTDDDQLKALIGQVVKCEGSLADRSGQPGVDQALIDSFYAHCQALVDWIKLSETSKEAILPYGERTEEAYSVFSTIKTKVDDYFLRCQMAEFDPVSVETLNAINARLEAINSKALPECVDEIASFPLAKIEAHKPLPLTTGINPAWRAKILAFRELISSKSKKGKQELTEKEGKEVVGQFEAFQSWKAGKAGSEVEVLGLDAVQQILTDSKKDALLDLIAEDLKLKEEAENIILVEKMVRYYRDLFALLNNFVAFSDFYRPGSKAIFKAGNLYFDQRRCDLCIKVSDMPKHNSMATSSGICLVYCDCYSKTKNEKMTIAAAFTDGDVDNLEVGRNAVFYDNAGNDWDATIIKIIDNPISIRQAFWSPYRKFSKFVSKQVEKLASSKENQVIGSTTSNIEKSTAQLATAPAGDAARPAPFDIAKFAGIFAAIGLAFGAIGGVLAAFAKGFLALTWWKMPLAIAGIMLVISGPSMILAWLKLRKRNLAPVLDANGWAINARATINIAFGATLTHLAKLPKNSRLNFIDPYKKKSNPWLVFALIVIVILIVLYLFLRLGLLTKWGLVPDLGSTIPGGAMN